MNEQSVVVLVEELDHPEGVAWGQDGFLYAGGEAGQIYRIDVRARTTELVGSTEGVVLGISLDAIGDIYICNAGRCEVLRMTQDGQVSMVSRGSADRPFVTPNFPVFDASGRLFVSDSGTWDRDDGCIFVIEPDGATAVWSTEVSSFPNGLAIDPAGEYLYVAESTGPAVSRLKFEPDGRAGSPELVLELPGTVPDGLAFAADGGLIVACYRPDVIYRLDALGNLSVYAEDSRGTLLAAPTNVCFGGPGLGTLYSANFGRWHISELPGSLVGAPLNYPAGLR